MAFTLRFETTSKRYRPDRSVFINDAFQATLTMTEIRNNDNPTRITKPKCFFSDKLFAEGSNTLNNSMMTAAEATEATNWITPKTTGVSDSNSLI